MYQAALERLAREFAAIEKMIKMLPRYGRDLMDAPATGISRIIVCDQRSKVESGLSRLSVSLYRSLE